MVIAVIYGTKVMSFYGNYGYLWYQGYQFSMVIVVISGTKIIHFYGNYGYLWYQGYQFLW